MQISHTMMYWFVKLDDIRHFFGGLQFLLLILIFTAIGIGVTCAIHNDSIEKYTKRSLLIAAIFIACFILFAATRVLIPSTKQMAAIVVLPAIVNNEQVQELPNKLVELSTAWLEELKPAKPESGAK